MIICRSEGGLLHYASLTDAEPNDLQNTTSKFWALITDFVFILSLFQ